jgi:hypothetical protein
MAEAVGLMVLALLAAMVNQALVQHRLYRSAVTVRRDERRPRTG